MTVAGPKKATLIDSDALYLDHYNVPTLTSGGMAASMMRKITNDINTNIMLFQDDFKQDNMSDNNRLLENENNLNPDDAKHSAQHGSTTDTELSKTPRR